KLQRWSQPSETFRYAVHHAPVLTRGETPCGGSSCCHPRSTTGALARAPASAPAIDDGRIRARARDRVGDAGEVARADECIHLRQLAHEIVREALGGAAGDDTPARLSVRP